MKSIFREYIEATSIRGVELPAGKTIGHLVVESLLRKAIEGDVRAIQLVFVLAHDGNDGEGADARGALLAEAEAIVSGGRDQSPRYG